MNFDVLSTQLQYVTMYHKSDSFCMYGTLILTHHSKFLGYTEPGLYCACTENKLTHIQLYPSQQTSLHSWTTGESVHSNVSTFLCGALPPETWQYRL